ncbi:MAG: redox-regulated ATPase YchF, partial [Patescibacteria group bacterium]
AGIVKTNKIVHALIEFVDIAGLVKDAHKGEGLGNKFLAHIRETSAICYVLRFFEDENVIHVQNRVDPMGDLAILNEELIFADLQTLENQKEPKQNSDKSDKLRYELVQNIKRHLNDAKPLRDVNLSEEELSLLKSLNLLTLKPVLYVANMSEEQLQQSREVVLKDFLHKPVVCLSAKLESELIDATPEDRAELLKSVGVEHSALDQLAKGGYDALNLLSFLTAGEIEDRAWTIRKGETAQQAAGVIHTDFFSKFIKADIVKYEDFIASGGWVNARQKGLVRSEGKEYIMQDGEVVEFKIGG